MITLTKPNATSGGGIKLNPSVQGAPTIDQIKANLAKKTQMGSQSKLPISSAKSSKWLPQFGASLKDEVIGAGKSFFGGTQALGKSVMGLFGADTSKLGVPEEKLQPKTQSEQMGGALEKTAELVGGFAKEAAGEVVPKAVTATKDFFQNTEKLFGKEAADIKGAKTDVIAKEFQAGKRTVADTGQKIMSAISSFKEKSKSALEAVFNQLPKDISFKPSDIVTAVNKGMQRVVSGVEKASGTTLRSIDDLLTKTKFTPDEQKVVGNLVDRVKGWTNNTPRGLAELRRVIYDEFHRGDGSISDKVISKVNEELKNLITSTSKEYGPALGKSVDNIEKAEGIAKSLMDKDGNIVESKLIAFAKKLKDPALGADQKQLFEEVLGNLSSDVRKELEGFNNYKILQGLKKQGKGLWGTAKKVGIATGIAGGIGAGGEEIKRFFTGR